MEVNYGLKTNRIESGLEKRSWVNPTRDFVIWIVFLLVILAGLITWSVTKPMSISDDMTDYVEYNAAADESEMSEWTLMQPMVTSEKGSFSIELPPGTRADRISVRNCYQDHALLVKIKGAKASLFGTDKIFGDVSIIQTAAYRDYNGELCISIIVDGLWEYDVTQDNGKLVVTPFKADTKYDYKVVIVPEQMISEVDITGRIAELATSQLADESVRVYSSRLVGRSKNIEETVAFIEETDADVVIVLSTTVSEDADEYGLSAQYNGNYYLPELNNAIVAEAFLRNVTVATKNKADVISEADSETILSYINRPAAQINIGYTSNEKEYSFLQDERYQQNIVSGIVEAIREVKNR